MATMPGPSSMPAKTRQPTSSQADRQCQQTWIQLIDAWHSSGQRPLPFATVSRDQLVEEISQHAQTLCRTIRDRSWLLDAFHMAIHAVLLSESQINHNDELGRIEQLAQQLLQLAIHSVATPYLCSLNEHNAQSSRIHAVSDALEQFERLARRVSVHARLRGLTQMLALPMLPLALVLGESTGSVLLCLASLPQGANLVAPLLQSFPWLVEESASIRRPLLAQLLTAGRGGRQVYASLAASGLLICWKHHTEASIWRSAKGVQMLSLREMSHFYSDVLQKLNQSNPDTEAHFLLDVLANESQGHDAQQAIAELHTTISSKPISDNHSTPAPASPDRFDLTSIKTLVSQVAASSGNNEARKQLAQQLATSQNSSAVARRVAQLVDTNDSVSIRSFALTVMAEATNRRSDAAAQAASVLYARPAVGGFRVDLNTPQTLLKQADAVLSQIQAEKHEQDVRANVSRLAGALRGALKLDPHIGVPACQLLVLLSSGTHDEAGVLVGEIRLHLRWLRDVARLVEGQSDKFKGIDLCWFAAYGGGLSSDVSDEVRMEAEKQQTWALESLLSSFDAAHPAPIRSTASSDPAMLRFRAAWDAFFHHCLELCGPSPSAPFALVAQPHMLRVLLSQVLRTGDVELFHSLTSSTTASHTLPPSDVEDLVLHVSTSLFDKAPLASTRNKHIRLSLEILSSLPTTSARASAQRDFIEAACRLSSFKITSMLHPGRPMEPKEMRETTDKMHLIARMLSTQADAHRSPELVLDLANRLCGLNHPSPSERTLIETRTLAMLADAATAAEEFEHASSFCQRLIEKTNSHRKRASSNRVSAEVVELGWKTCLQMSKHPLWQDTPRRISMLAHAMTLCPPTHLNAMLRQWHSLDQQLVTELEGGKTFASTKKTASAGGWGVGGVGEIIRGQTAATVGAGLVGTAANLLPLSFSPLSYFGSAGGGAGASMNGGRGGGEGERVDARTAKLFDFDSVSGASDSGMYVDPTERAVRAARAARDFLGWKSQHPAEDIASGSGGGGSGGGGGGGGGIGGFSFSRGVGWLIGETDKH